MEQFASLFSGGGGGGMYSGSGETFGSSGGGDSAINFGDMGAMAGADINYIHVGAALAAGFLFGFLMAKV